MKKCKFNDDDACTLPHSVHKTCDEWCWNMIVKDHPQLVVDVYKDLFS